MDLYKELALTVTRASYGNYPHNTHTHIHPFDGPISGTTRVSQYQKGKTNLDLTEARDSEWQWHQLGRMQVCTSLQTDNHASTPPLSFLQAGCPSCHPTNSVEALKAKALKAIIPGNYPHRSRLKVGWLVEWKQTDGRTQPIAVLCPLNE